MLTRDYRPQTFSEMAGNIPAVSVLNRIAKNPERAPRSIILCGPHGQGKCVVKGSLIKSEKGLRRIEDLSPGGPLIEQAFYKAKEKVLVHGKLEEVSAFFYGGERDLIFFETEEGNKLGGTLEHPVLSWDKDKFDLTFKELSLLKRGDTVIQDISPVPWNLLGSTVWVPSKDPIETKKKCLEAKARQALDNSQAFFLGLLIGDGLQYGLSPFHSSDLDLLDWIQDYLDMELKVSSKRSADSNHEGFYNIDIVPNDVAFNSWLKYLGVFNRRVEGKKVPDIIWNTTWSNQCAFIRGLLKMTQNSPLGRMEYGTNFEDLALFVFHMHNSQGIVCKMREGNTQSKRYILTVGGIRYDNVIPGGVLFIKKLLAGVKLTRRMRKALIEINRYFLEKPEISYGSFKEVKIKLENLIPELRGRFPDLPNSLFFAKVKGIEKGRGEVYDLTNSKSHMFVANSILVHNTTAARIFARAVNCEKRNGDCCNECAGCKASLEGGAQYHEFDSAVVGNVNTIRQMRDILAHSSLAGWRVAVLDESHLVSNQAQSALLKILEDSTAKIFYIFSTTDIGGLIDTIVSRSLVLRYPFGTNEEVCSLVKAVSEREGIDLPKEALDIIVRRAGGHFRDSLQGLELFVLMGDEFTKCVGVLDNDIRAIIQLLKAGKSPKLVIDRILSEPVHIIRQDFDKFIRDLAEQEFTGDVSNSFRFDLIKYYLKMSGYLKNTTDWSLFLYSIKSLMIGQVSSSKSRFTK